MLTRTAIPLLVILALSLLTAFSACSPTDPTVPVLEEPPCEPVPLSIVDSGRRHPDFAFLRMPDVGDTKQPMDHSIVVDESGVLHCFWIRGSDWIGGDGIDLGHASTADMITWSPHDRVKPVNPDYSIDRVWAPQVIREDSRWWMYFCGVEFDSIPAENVQRIFVTSSTDLLDWSEAELVLEPRHALTTWGSGAPWSSDARDPVLFRENGALRMLLTVRHVDGGQAIALADRAAGAWSVTAILDSVQGRVMESPSLYEHEGTLHLTVNNWTDGGTRVWTATDVLGPWTKGPEILRGFAFEFLPVGNDAQFCSRVWGSSILFTRFDPLDHTASNAVFEDCGGMPAFALK
ncbi:hypothetical protein DRQ53_06940 [bacterium]|nr:MAG: hypothetical protein DRQ32_10225 [bacterium]RKZ16210.1 MAG: hypothetical protein DRQ53_06940 [bacterium]